MKKDEKTSLSLNPKAVGKEIVDAALSAHRKIRNDKVIGQVTSLMQRIEVLGQIQTKTEKRLELCQSQLAAIESGDFTLKQYSGDILFNDDTLNVDWDSTEKW